MHAAAAQYRLASQYSSLEAETSKIHNLWASAQAKPQHFVLSSEAIPLASGALIPHHARHGQRHDVDPTSRADR